LFQRDGSLVRIVDLFYCSPTPQERQSYFWPYFCSLALEASAFPPAFPSGGHKKDKRNRKQKPQPKREKDRPKTTVGSRT